MPARLIGHFAISPHMGMKIVTTEHAYEYVGDRITVIPIAKNRSARIWKKLRQRRMRSAKPINRPCAYEANGTLFVHPSIERALQQQITVSQDRMFSDLVFGRAGFA